MKNILLILLGLCVILTSGCRNGKKTEDSNLSDNNQPEIITEDIEVIAKNDTSGRVNAAKEAATKLIADAKAEAARIKKEADGIMAVKSQEAEKKAEELFASMKANMKKDQAAAVKKYLLEKKTEAEDGTKKMLDSAKTKASELKASAFEYANKLKEKGKNESDKIANQVIQNARKSAADITSKANNEALKIKKRSSELFEAAKTFTDKKKKEAEAYVKQKLDEADKAVAKIKIKLKEEGEDKAKPVLANSILDKIIEGMKDEDYDDFTQNFTADLKGNFTKKRFQALNKQLKGKIGDYQKRTYLGTLTKGPLTVYLWKSQFSNAKNNDLVIRLTLGELDGKEQVFAFDISNL